MILDLLNKKMVLSAVSSGIGDPNTYQYAFHLKKTLWVRMKIASLGDFVVTCISILCSNVKCKCLWRGRLVMVSFANIIEYSPKSGFMA